MAIYTPSPANVNPRLFLPCPDNDETKLEPGMIGIKSGDGGNEIWYKPFKNLVGDADTTPIQLLSTSSNPLNNQASVDPTVDNDNTEGYSVFSQWHNTTSDVVFILVSATTGAADWVPATNNYNTLDSVTANNNLLSRTMDVSSGNIAGITAAALGKDAVNRLALQRMSMPLYPVISELATPPSTPDPGDRYLVADGATGVWSDHDGEVAEAIPCSLSTTSYTQRPTSTISGGDVAPEFYDTFDCPEWGMTIGVSRTGTRAVEYSRDGGRTWTGITVPSGTWRKGCFSPKLCRGVIVGSSGTGNRAIYSDDGITWNYCTTGEDNTLLGAIWSEGFEAFFAVSIDGTNQIQKSTDGITFTAQTAPASSGWVGLCEIKTGNGFYRLISCAYTGSVTGLMMYTDNGTTWTAIDMTSANRAYRDVEWFPEWGNSGRVIAVSEGALGNDMAYSDDLGLTWEIKTTPAGAYQRIVRVPEIDGTAIAVSSDSIIATSSDGGDTWVSRTAPNSNEYRGLAWVSRTGNAVIMSVDGTNKAVISAVDTRWLYEPLLDGQSVYDQENLWTWTKQADGLVPSIDLIFRGSTSVTTTDETVTETLYLNQYDTSQVVNMPAGWGAPIEIVVSAVYSTGSHAIIKGFAWWSKEGISASPSWTTEINDFSGTLTIDTTPQLLVESSPYNLRIRVSHTTASYVGTESNMRWVATVKGAPIQPVTTVIC